MWLFSNEKQGLPVGLGTLVLQTIILVRKDGNLQD